MKLNILSLFDGMSCGQIALERAGITVDNYFASEIDKYAIQVTMANYPDTKQLGSVVNVNGSDLPKIDLLIGGSPCQSFSFAGKRKGMATKFETEILTLNHYLELKADGYEFEGQSYLFWEFMRLLNECKPKYFLLENVEMGEKWEKVLSKAIGVNGIHINSALVSAQNRKRIYWTNIGMQPGGLFGDLVSIIRKPKDKGILLKDVLENEVDEKYFLSKKMVDYLSLNSINQLKKGNGFSFKPTDGNKKGSAVTNPGKNRIDDNYIKIAGLTEVRTQEAKQIRKETGTNPKRAKELMLRTDGKIGAILTSQTPDNLVSIMLGRSESLGAPEKEDGKHFTLCKGQSHGIKYNNAIRRLTPLECERLQTVKDIENNVIFALCYESAKSYVSAVNQNPKLLKLVLDAEQSELNELVKSVWLNMSVSHQSIKHTVLQNADMQTQKGINQCTNHNQQESNTNANNAELNVMCSCQREWENFAQPNVFINIIEGRIMHFGLEELPQNANHSIAHKSIKNPLKLFGKEIMQLVEDVEKNLNTRKDNNSTFITSHRLSIKNLEQVLTTYYLFAKNVTTGYTQNTTPIKSLSLKFNLKDGYTATVSDSQRYKMLGNGWTVDVISHIFSYLK